MTAARSQDVVTRLQAENDGLVRKLMAEQARNRKLEKQLRDLKQQQVLGTVFEGA